MKANLDLRDTFRQTWTETGRCGDEYYREMTAWITSRMQAGSAELCYRLAMVYDRALDKFIADVGHSSAPERSGSGIDLAARYKVLLSRDLEYLSGTCDGAGTKDEADPIH